MPVSPGSAAYGDVYGPKASVGAVERAGLQIGHRVGSAALLLLAAGSAAFVARQAHRPLLLLAFACADTALLGAFLALVAGSRAGRSGREALVTVIFSAVVLVATVTLLLLSRRFR